MTEKQPKSVTLRERKLIYRHATLAQNIDLQILITKPCANEWHLPLGITTSQVRTWQQR